MSIYKYGMKYRGFSIGCQPMENLIKATEDETGKYYNVLEYSEPLTAEQINNYQLADLQKKPGIDNALIEVFKPLNKPFLKDLQAYSKEISGENLIVLIRDYAKNHENEPDFIEYLEDLKSNNSIGCMSDYYEIIDYLQEETST